MDSNIKFNILNVQNVYPMFDETTVSLSHYHLMNDGLIEVPHKRKKLSPI